MTDREMLELAAKAARVDGPVCEMLGGSLCIVNKHAPLGMWAPLTDDGDALRLAVKLHLLDNLKWWLFYDTTIDACAATRRAFVRAAAEIGRQA